MLSAYEFMTAILDENDLFAKKNTALLEENGQLKKDLLQTLQDVKFWRDKGSLTPTNSCPPCRARGMHK